MAERFQAAPLVASPSYPNSVAWSDDNLLAVASGHLVTILNPNVPLGPRGLITIPVTKPFRIGVVDKKELLSGGLLPVSLSRETRPCVRSISWSPIGLAPNSGCLLAVCTTEGRVKLYRFPFCEFTAEWVEVTDISEMLFSYLTSVSFWESDVCSAEVSDVQEDQQGKKHRRDDLPIPESIKGFKLRRHNESSLIEKSVDAFTGVALSPRSLSKEGSFETNCEDIDAAVETPTEDMDGKMSLQIVTVPNSKSNSIKKVPEKGNLPLISNDQYASRNSMLASLVVAWSPVLQTTSSSCSILAVGSKSGIISFWNIHKPKSYSIVHRKNPTAGLLIGFLHAHRSWITAISWALSVSDSSSSQLFLATGSSDGSVKIWQCYSEELVNSSQSNHCSFTLFNEVVTVDFIPISVLSLIVPVHTTNSMYLAAGKGSGSFEVWKWEISARKYHKVGSFDAHGQIITGLAWAFDGNCLYSCSQDDTVRSWVLSLDSLHEVPLPSNTPDVKSSTDVPAVFDLCFGLAKSPGDLAIAVARTFDADLLNPMYQIRSQKAAVEFFWIGSQQLDKLSNEYPVLDVEAFPNLSENELVLWEHNILWSLKQSEHLEKPLVIWDIVAALLAFKQSAPKFVDHILAKWLRAFMGSNSVHSLPQMVSDLCKCLYNISSRQLQLLNIIIRKVVLKELKADKINGENQSLEAICEAADEQATKWMKLLKSSEKELRERLVFCSFSAVIDIVSHSSQNRKSGYWQPVGLAQHEQWVKSNHDCVRDYLKVLQSKVEKIKKSKLRSVSEYITEEQCSYCSAYVPFESVEAAFCQGVNCVSGDGRKHKLSRCSASMLVNPITPSWFCVCCHRWASRLAPPMIFTMLKFPLDVRFPLDVNTIFATLVIEATAKPLCPFCGIQLQRLQPEFLLSASPV